MGEPKRSRAFIFAHPFCRSHPCKGALEARWSFVDVPLISRILAGPAPAHVVRKRHRCDRLTRGRRIRARLPLDAARPSHRARHSQTVFWGAFYATPRCINIDSKYIECLIRSLFFLDKRLRYRSARAPSRRAPRQHRRPPHVHAPCVRRKPRRPRSPSRRSGSSPPYGAPFLWAFPREASPFEQPR